MKQLFFIFFVCCFALISIWADGMDFLSEYVSRGYTKEEGLPANTVSDIFQDDKGYIYIGTYEGLVRFDGVNFNVYNRSLDEKFAFVSSRFVCQSKDGAIWVGSNDEGVFRIVMDSSEDVVSFSKANGLANNSVRSLCEDKKGNIWVATAGGIRYITPDFKVENPDEAFQNSHSDLKGICNEVYCAKNGRVWVSTDSAGGIYYFENGRFSEYHFNDSSLDKNTVTCVSEDNSGELWFGLSPHFAVRGEGAGAATYDLAVTSGRGTCVNSIVEDKNGVIWFATDAGIVTLRGGELTQITENDGLVDNSVNKILEDREGNIWFATDHAGIQKLNHGIFKVYPLLSSGRYNQIPCTRLPDSTRPSASL